MNKQKIQKDLDAGKFNQICSNETNFKEYVFPLIDETEKQAYKEGLSLRMGYCDDELIARIKEQAQKEMREIKDKYQELILAVENKHQGETRHQTALRYIKNAEKSSGQVSENK
jgi:hypothetical protein